MLALLLLHANEVVSADRLIDELWGDSPPESAGNMLQGYVSHLRKTLEPGRARGQHELLVSQPPGYVLHIASDQLDAERFQRLAGEGRRMLAEGDAETAAERLRAALALWRGPALDDLAYEEFTRADIDRLEEVRLAALEDRIDADLALGRHDALVGELRELVDQHPPRERLRAQLMAALYRCGRQVDALEAYREARRALHDELGIEPGPALRDLEQAILRQDPALGAPPHPPRPIAKAMRRGWPLLVSSGVLAGAALAGVLALTHSGGAKPVVARPNSVAVIDPSKSVLVGDIPVGRYPGPIAADQHSVYVCNIGDATVTSIDPAARKVSGNFSLSRAIDLVAVNNHLWAANGGVAGHTPYPPGTVVDLDFSSYATRTIRVGPSLVGNEEQTTIAADTDGAEIWAGNADSDMITQLEPPTMAKVRGLAPGGLAAVSGLPGEGDTVWVGDPSRNLVVRIDGNSRLTTHRIRVPGHPTRVAADVRAVWVITNGHDYSRPRARDPAVWRIDPNTNAPVAKIPLPLTPVRIAIGAGSVWVTAQRVMSSTNASVDATVFRIDPTSNSIVARIPLHTRAVDGIVVSRGLVWVAVPPSQ